MSARSCHLLMCSLAIASVFALGCQSHDERKDTQAQPATAFGDAGCSEEGPFSNANLSEAVDDLATLKSLTQQERFSKYRNELNSFRQDAERIESDSQHLPLSKATCFSKAVAFEEAKEDVDSVVIILQTSDPFEMNKAERDIYGDWESNHKGINASPIVIEQYLSEPAEVKERYNVSPTTLREQIKIVDDSWAAAERAKNANDIISARVEECRAEMLAQASTVKYLDNYMEKLPPKGS